MATFTALKRCSSIYLLLAFVVTFIFFNLRSLPLSQWVDSTKELNPSLAGDARFQPQNSVTDNQTATNPEAELLPPDDENLETKQPTSSTPQPVTTGHPIDKLIERANKQFDALLKKRTFTLNDAAMAYRERRGRHPPPGFDLWFDYAKKNDAIIIEDFWDQIYEDLEPFWAVPPAILRTQSRKLGMAVAVKDGRASATTDWFWHVIWAKMIDEVAQYLPDILIPLNPMDESRIIVPWNDITKMLSQAHSEKTTLIPPQGVKSVTTSWSEEGDDEISIPDIEWKDDAPYSDARLACPPESPVRQYTEILSPSQVMSVVSRFDKATNASSTATKPFAEPDFVRNYTESTNMCNDPTIGFHHSALTYPLSSSTSTKLLPMFGGSKIAGVNNEILLPAPMYWNEEERFAEEDEVRWSQKGRKVMWRGTATGGRNRPETWSRFHRHRFVALTNGTKFAQTDPKSSTDNIWTPLWEMTAIQPLRESLQRNLSKWLARIMDVAFTDLFCDTDRDENGNEAAWGECWYTSPHYRILPAQKLSWQYQFKYLPDIDGNSFSGRYRSFLLSNSLPIKATLYREWHDSRLVPWKHFVPMNNRFDDFYRIMEYFAGCNSAECEEPIPDHDKQGEAIAIAGRDWAQRTLRKVDMQIYVFRLLLEWARVTNDERMLLGWVEDAKQQAPFRSPIDLTKKDIGEFDT